MSVQHLKPGDRFVTILTQFNTKITWEINEYGVPKIISREENPNGVSQ